MEYTVNGWAAAYALVGLGVVAVLVILLYGFAGGLGMGYGLGRVGRIRDARKGIALVKSTPLLEGWVIDAGGGQVGVMVDRDTKEYPPVGMRVLVSQSADIRPPDNRG